MHNHDKAKQTIESIIEELSLKPVYDNIGRYVASSMIYIMAFKAPNYFKDWEGIAVMVFLIALATFLTYTNIKHSMFVFIRIVVPKGSVADIIWSFPNYTKYFVKHTWKEFFLVIMIGPIFALCMLALMILSILATK